MKDLEPATGEHPQENNVIERKFGMGHIGTIFASGSALFSDGYANAANGPALYFISNYVYPDAVTKQKKQLLASMGFAGQVIGQLSFGWISDKIGRKFSMLVCTGMVFVFSLLAACSKGVNDSGTIDALIAWRTLLGIGIGGEYPAGSVAAAENTEDTQVKKKSQQKLFVLATNTMLDFAFAIAYFVALVLLWIFGLDRAQFIWRGTVGLGIVPPAFLLYFRLKMKEPQVYRAGAMKQVKIPYWLIIKRYWVKLLAVSITWFIYDWITYPFGLYSTEITNVADPNSTVYSIIGWGCLINAFYIPGTLAGAFIVDYLGPKYTMIFGLCMQALFGFVLSGCYNLLVPNHIAGFAVMYGLFLAFGEVGPGNNLGLLASKAIGPTATRGQLYGIAAAIGKVGAFIGSYTFPQIQLAMNGYGPYASKTGLFYIGSALALVSALITFLFVPNIKADAMREEEVLFREYLERNGFDTSQMGIHDERFESDVSIVDNVHQDSKMH